MDSKPSSRISTWWKVCVPTRESLVVLALLVVIFEATYLLAFYIRGELLFKASDAKTIISTLGYVIAIKLAIFYLQGLCHRPWRAARFQDLNNLLRVSTTALLVLVVYNYFGQYVIPDRVVVPRSVLLLDWAFTILGVGGMQALARSIYEELMPAMPVGKHVVLVIDADESGRRLADHLAKHDFIAGLLDDNPLHYGVHVGKARVLGPVAMASACAERLRATDIVIRAGAVYGRRLQELCDACAAIKVRVRIAEVQGLADRDSMGSLKTIEANAFRVRDIELRDLLTRPQVNLANEDEHVLPFINGKCVLVTGAGGSIGSEICRQVMRFEPRRLLLVERSEYSLFAVHRELTAAGVSRHVEVVPVLADITNVDRTDRMLADHKPDVVIHAAAFKHVPLMESHPVEAIENNTLATAALAELADAHGVEAFVTLSTDKAVHPSSLMGASKLVAERFLQSFGEVSRTRFVTVRFGNVLGSSGSAVPIFQDQLVRRLPITITHPEVRRYFMTIGEAAQLVLFAGSIPGAGGTYVLEMGGELRIVDVVHSLAFLMRIPREDLRIQYCGLRQGEKLSEELFFEDEQRQLTDNPLVIRVSRPARSRDEVRAWLAELKEAAGSDPQTAAAAIMRIVSRDCSALTPRRPAAALTEGPSDGFHSGRVASESTDAEFGEKTSV